VSTLRQWHASASHPIDFALFCRGEHLHAGRENIEADVLNWVLYPDDSTPAGRELRLKQEYFLVSASLQDIVQRHLHEQRRLDNFGDKNVIHLNDTHPALAPVELMRLLHDVHGLDWDTAWAQVRAATSYTNHTLMPEALEHWPMHVFKGLLPRHAEIVYEINHRFLDEVRERFPDDTALAGRLSLIDESGDRRLRMASLSIVASHRVNGVSELHSELMVRTIFADFARLYPERFANVTNGVTPRRWLMQANPALAAHIDAAIGGAWRRDLDRLSDLAALADDAALGRAVMDAKRYNKRRLTALIAREVGVAVDPDSLFDVQVKRIHEYKRQLLNLLQVVARYQAMLERPDDDWQPRTVVLAGKAASAYVTAKTIVRLAHDLGRVINADARLRGRLRLVFLPNYSVSLAEVIIPAADLSQQISTAGTEASGTGNMKFALNGALTIGTWDGANIEMAQAMGEQNMFVFGLRAAEVAQAKERGYDPRRHYDEDPVLRGALDAVRRGEFSPDDPQRYAALVDSLLYEDRYLVLADFDSYLATQRRVDALYRKPATWAETALCNVAAMGRFSSDRTVRDYMQRIWRVPA
jgi:starch phosphorylase